ncbi:MAG: hypothetical protein EU529_04945 [Promethearchaeota archaeon]|nr:MAG: hypothetical protein EU529_04945 [Candidatus Lokiarchaeota archaeon]
MGCIIRPGDEVKILPDFTKASILFDELRDYVEEVIIRADIEILTRIGTILDETLYSYMGLKASQFRTMKYRLNKKNLPSLYFIPRVYLNLYDKLRPYVSDKDWKTIECKINELYSVLFRSNLGFSDFKSLYLNPQIVDFSKFKELFRSFKYGQRSSHIVSQKRFLIDKLELSFFSIFLEFREGKRSLTTTDRHLSNLLFDKAYRTNIFTATEKEERINLPTLLALIYRIDCLTLLDLKSKGVNSANLHKLERLKDNFRAIIEDFIVSNPYIDSPYIGKWGETIIEREPEFYRPELELLIEFYIAFSNQKGREISLEELKNELGINPGFLNLHDVSIITWNTFLKLVGEFKGNYYFLGILHKSLTCKNYKRTSQALRIYRNDREINPPKESGYHENWNDRDLKDFHIVILLLRDLGHDIRNLQPIDSSSFLRQLNNKYKFRRHHIFKESDRKSLDPNKLALVIQAYHYALESLDTSTVNDLISKRLNWNDNSCPQFYKELFPDDWNDLWQEIIERRDYLKQRGVEEFLKKYYPDVVTRVFGNRFVKGSLETKVRNMIYNWIKLGNPIPNLPDYLDNILIGPIQQKITNYLGNL